MYFEEHTEGKLNNSGKEINHMLAELQDCI